LDQNLFMMAITSWIRISSYPTQISWVEKKVNKPIYPIQRSGLFRIPLHPHNHQAQLLSTFTWNPVPPVQQTYSTLTCSLLPSTPNPQPIILHGIDPEHKITGYHLWSTTIPG
jgi:hypothetical protein